MRTVSRRTLLIGGGLSTAALATGVVGVESEVLPGRSWAYRRLGLDGPDGVVPDSPPGHVVTGVLTSAARGGKQCGWAVSTPLGRRRDLPVVVVLHGRGDDESSVFDPQYLGLDRFLSSAIADGTPPFALASIDGGETYWHARDDGDDAAAMVIQEFLPLLAARGLRTDRVGLMGWSMGGYGALHVAALLGRDRVSGVAAMSPAIWDTYADSAPGAFDDEQDFADATVVGRQDELSGVPVRIDCGTGDPFYGATRDYVSGFQVPPAGGFERGGHGLGYWRRMAGPQLRFLGPHIS